MAAWALAVKLKEKMSNMSSQMTRLVPLESLLEMVNEMASTSRSNQRLASTQKALTEGSLEIY